MRVIMWILGRADGSAHGVKTPIGYEPTPEDLNLEGLNLSEETVASLLAVDPKLWREDIASVKEFYARFGGKLPEEMKEQLAALEARLS